MILKGGPANGRTILVLRDQAFVWKTVVLQYEAMPTGPDDAKLHMFDQPPVKFIRYDRTEEFDGEIRVYYCAEEPEKTMKTQTEMESIILKRWSGRRT